MEEPIKEPETNKPNQADKNLPFPRFFARVVDSFIGTIIVSIVGVIFFIGFEIDLKILDNTFLYSMFFFLLLIFIESFFLATWGNTFGKWFFRVKIRKINGKISFLNAFHRSVLVYVCGLVFGIPVISLFGMAHAYDRIKKKGITYWDEECGFIVECEKLNWWRILVIVLFSLLAIEAYRLGQQQ